MKIRKEEKMNKPLLIISLCLFIFLGPTAFAQPGHTSMDIIGSYKPKIPDAQKITEQPSIEDSVSEKFKIEYELNSRRVSTVYEVDPIKAANMRGEKLKKLYNGYAKGGFGTYMTPYAELFYNTGRSKKHSSGVHYRHLSSTGQIADVGYSGFSRNTLNLHGKSFIKKSTLSGGLDYDRNVMHYYGFNTNPYESYWDTSDVNLERDGIKQRYQLIGVQASINDNYPVDSQATKYKTGLSFYNYRDRFNVEENNFKAFGDVSFYYKTYDLYVKGTVDYFKNDNDSISQNNTIIDLRPGIRFKKDLWRLNAGLAVISAFGEVGEFKVVPELDFDLHLFKNIIILNIGTDTRYDRTSYRALTTENPFLINTVELRNAWKPFRWYAGLRGAVSSRLSFNLRASYVQITNQHFFVNDTTEGNWNKLTVVYDNPNLFEVNGELTWQKHEKLRLVARLDYLGYGMDALSQAWHVPSLRLNLSGKYNLKDKIWITATVIGLNRQFARTFVETAGNVLPVENEERIKGLADVNLGAEYRYNKRLGMYLQLNNILNVRYDRYLYYPTQRFNLLGGISYSF
jgi:hypothetical protein